MKWGWKDSTDMENRPLTDKENMDTHSEIDSDEEDKGQQENKVATECELFTEGIPEKQK